MSLTDYIVGALYFVIVAGAAATSSWLLVRARLGWIAIEARIVAWALLFIAAVALAHLVPLMLGVLTRGTAAGASILTLAGVTRVRQSQLASETPRGRPQRFPQWLLASLALVIAFGYALAFLRANRSVAIGDIDSTMIHLPTVAGWIRSGSIWRSNDFVPGWGFGAYPQTGNLVQLAVTLPWHDDFLVRLVNPASLALGGLVVYALAAELNAPRAVAVTLAAGAVTVPVAAQVGLQSGMTDAPMAATLAAGMLFLIRHARTRRRSELVLAGLGLGLAFGTKWYGPPDAAVLLGIAWLLGGRGARATRDLLFTAAVTFAAGGFWLVRNVVIYADPIFPARVHMLGITIFDGPRRTASTGVAHPLLHYLTDSHVLGHVVWPQIVDSFALAGGLLLLGTGVALVTAGRRRERRAVACAAAALAVTFVWLGTPDSALEPQRGLVLVVSATRYALPALMIGAAVCAWLASLSPRLAIGFQFVTLIAIVQAVSRERGALGLTLHSLVVACAVAAVIGSLVLLARRRRHSVAWSPAMLAALGLLAFALLGAGGRKLEQDFNAARYRNIEPSFEYLATHAASPYRVALTGNTGRNPYSSPIVAFGPRLENDVAYVGTKEHHLLRRYGSRAAFLRGLRSGRYDLLLVADSDRELPWAQAAGWIPVAIDNNTIHGFALLRAPKQRQAAR